MTDDRVAAYLAPLFWQEDDLLRSLLDDLAARGPTIQVGRDSARVLQLLVHLLRAERVLEIGTLFGYSAIWMARALPLGGRLDTIEVDPVHAEAATGWIARAGLDDRVRVVRGAALDVLPTLEGPYDLAFIDAVKTEYLDYLDHCLRLVRPGGVIAADNVLWHGQVVDPTADDPNVRAIRDYNRRIATEPRLLSTILTIGDGLAVSVVRRAEGD